MAFWQSPLVAFVKLRVLSIESQRKWNISRPSLVQDNGSGLVVPLNGVKRSHGPLLAEDYLKLKLKQQVVTTESTDHDHTLYSSVLIINVDKV